MASSLFSPSFWQKWYRGHVLKFYRRMRHPRELKKSRLKKWLAKHFLHRSVWKPNRHTFSGGMSCGFFSMMFILPGQAPFAAILAGLFRVNIPIAMICTWIVNPVTMLPVAWLEIKIGVWLLNKLRIQQIDMLDWDSLQHAFSQIGQFRTFLKLIEPWVGAMYLGAAVLGLITALAGYAVCMLIWEIWQMLAHRRNKISD